MGKLVRVKWCLLGCLIVVLALAVGSVFIPNRLTDAVKWLANNEIAYKLRPISEREPDQEYTLIEMTVETVVVSESDFQPVVILKEKDGELRLPIWIGPNEASAIMVILEGVQVPRPLTPDLLCSTIDRMGASVDYIVINKLENHIFYADLVINVNWMKAKIDARPSDAIAIALRVGAPIYVDKEALDKAKFQPAQEADKHTFT